MILRYLIPNYPFSVFSDIWQVAAQVAEQVDREKSLEYFISLYSARIRVIHSFFVSIIFSLTKKTIERETGNCIGLFRVLAIRGGQLLVLVFKQQIPRRSASPVHSVGRMLRKRKVSGRDLVRFL